MESKLWYKNPSILVEDWQHFFPTHSLSRTQKINAIARFAIYYSLLIIIFKQDTKWFSISVVLLVLSLFLGTTEAFSETNKKENSKCVRPTKVNPFMNFTLADYMSNSNRASACEYDEVKDEMREEFTKDIVPDPADLWGKNISDRNFFTMPWTQVVNDQTGFANWLYGNSGDCKDKGINCEKNHDNRYHRSRYYRI
jgi:hypothetical protein